ncbi:MAG: hypothetical protein C4523_05530 [Myxococcales bacterium]|nr:MAG: hypothetical protein C4523_05530 [Myxococcales bacterium]
MSGKRHFCTETETKQLLAHYGVPVAEGAETASPDEAAAEAKRLGFPVVLKVSHPDLAHKSDAGGVCLGLDSEVAVSAAAVRLLALKPGARVRVEREADEGIADLILGFRRDPVFGPVFMVGMGGIFAEVMADRALHVGALDERSAASLLEGLKGRAMLEGARGRTRADRAAVVQALLALSRLAYDRPDVEEMDINPFRVYALGALALDGLAVVKGELEAAAIQGSSAKEESGGERVRPLFRPASVAVVGPSSTGRKAGNIILENLRTFGYPGTVFPVNPSSATIDGLPSYPSVADCPQPPELAVLAVPYHQVEKVVQDVARAGTRHVIVASGGFSDAGEEGRRRERELLRFCREHGIYLMGPNSIGTLDSRFGFCTSIGRLPPMPPSGISILGQSGTFATGFALEEITGRGRGFSKIACMGNKADIDECDFLEFYAQDEDTRSIGIYLESVKDGDRFRRAAEEAARKKPVVVLKSGRTALGAQAAASHTGAMAGADAVYDALFRQMGFQRVEDFAEFFGVLRSFDLCPLPAGNRIGVVSITGVGCVLAADACGAHGMTLAPITSRTRERLESLVPKWAAITNPADIWSTIEQRGPFEAYRSMCETMIADENVDILLLIAVLLEEGAFDAASALAPVRAAHPDKPLLACYLGGRRDLLDDFRAGLESIGVPVFDGPAAAVKTASYLVARTRLLARQSARKES